MYTREEALFYLSELHRYRHGPLTESGMKLVPIILANANAGSETWVDKKRLKDLDTALIQALIYYDIVWPCEWIMHPTGTVSPGEWVRVEYTP